MGLIGPNGAGKTTLLRACAGMVDHGGRIVVDGVHTSRARRRQLARLVAYVPQSPELPPDMSVGDYALLGRTPHLGYFASESAADRTACATLLEQLGLGAKVRHQLGTLSGGELQRVVLARALAQGAPVLLLDEPTSALDLGRRMDALELIDEIRRARGITVVSALHDLTLAGQFADRLVLLDHGRVVANGRPEAVLTERTLGRHYGTDVHVLCTPDGQLVVVPRRRAAPA